MQTGAGHIDNRPPDPEDVVPRHAVGLHRLYDLPGESMRA